MVFIGTTQDFIRYLASFETRKQLFPRHPLNDILDQLCTHQKHSTRWTPGRDFSVIQTCSTCGHKTYLA